MSTATTAPASVFQKVLDAVESLPESQQEHLLDIVQRRLVEARRAELAASVREARADYRAGRVRKGKATDLLKELRACAN
jgi:hypothetical protein